MIWVLLTTCKDSMPSIDKVMQQKAHSMNRVSDPPATPADPLGVLPLAVAIGGTTGPASAVLLYSEPTPNLSASNLSGARNSDRVASIEAWVRGAEGEFSLVWDRVACRA